MASASTSVLRMFKIPVQRHAENVARLEVGVLQRQHSLQLHVNDARQPLLGHALDRVNSEAEELTMVSVRLQELALVTARQINVALCV